MVGTASLGQDVVSASQVSGRRSLSGARAPAKSSLTAAPPSPRRANSVTSSARPPSGKKKPVVDSSVPREDLSLLALQQDLQAEPASARKKTPGAAYPLATLNSIPGDRRPKSSAQSVVGTVVRATE